MTDKAKDGEFAEWLAQRVSAANLSDEEKRVFADWLAKENKIPDSKPGRVDPDGYAGAPEATKITMHDVRELFSWIKGRVSHASINENERKELNNWLMQRATESGDVHENELKKLRQDLLD